MAQALLKPQQVRTSLAKEVGFIGQQGRSIVKCGIMDSSDYISRRAANTNSVVPDTPSKSSSTDDANSNQDSFAAYLNAARPNYSFAADQLKPRDLLDAATAHRQSSDKAPNAREEKHRNDNDDRLNNDKENGIQQRSNTQETRVKQRRNTEDVKEAGLGDDKPAKNDETNRTEPNEDQEAPSAVAQASDNTTSGPKSEQSEAVDGQARGNQTLSQTAEAAQTPAGTPLGSSQSGGTSAGKLNGDLNGAPNPATGATGDGDPTAAESFETGTQELAGKGGTSAAGLANSTSGSGTQENVTQQNALQPQPNDTVAQSATASQTGADAKLQALGQPSSGNQDKPPETGRPPIAGSSPEATQENAQDPAAGKDTVKQPDLSSLLRNAQNGAQNAATPPTAHNAQSQKGLANSTGGPSQFGSASGQAIGVSDQTTNLLTQIKPAATTATRSNGPALPLNSIAAHITRQAANGNNRFQIRLDPPELGRVDVKLDVSREGVVNTHLTVERPETLDLLQRDARALERALANAGLDTKQGTLSFSLQDQNLSGENFKEQMERGGNGTSDPEGTKGDDPEAASQTPPGQPYIATSGLDIHV